MVEKETVAQVIAANPTLPIYAWVNYEVCGSDDYCYWWADKISAKVTEITNHRAGYSCYDGTDIRIWEREDEDELRDLIREDPEEYLRDSTLCIADETHSAVEIRGLVEEHMASLKWKKCILLRVEV